jgi:CAAX prenyl protease-like protein
MAPSGFPAIGGIDFPELWRRWHPLIYAGKSLLAALLLWYLWPLYTRIRWNSLPLGVLAGLIGTPLWILTHYACVATGLWQNIPPASAQVYNPDRLLSSPAARIAYLCIRVAGPTLVVPVMEELFFRDFVMRALIAGSRFEEVAVGTFSWVSLLGMALLFGLNHGSMWPAGILYGLLMGLLLIRTRSLGACILAHALTNLTLYLYVIYTGDWQFM